MDTYRGGGGGSSNGERWFTYVLTTGANWKGPIGRALITCDLGGVANFAPLEIGPAGYRRHGKTLVWDLRNIEPASNIEIHWYPAFVNVQVNGRYPWSNGIAEAAHRIPTTINDFSVGISMDFRYITPVRRANDIWLPAKLAAQWLGATFAVEDPAKRVRIRRGKLWADVRDGSRTVRLSTGRTLTMPWASDYQRSSADPEHPYTMVSLGTLVTAFGGVMHYDRKADRMDIRLPKAR